MLFQQIATSIAAAAGEAGHEELAPLWAAPWVFGVVMFSILLVLMFVTLSYTNLGNRHEAVDEHADPHRQHPNKHDHGQGH
jgi:cytochrome c-type biogenesis protein CcmH/NrfG